VLKVGKLLEANSKWMLFIQKTDVFLIWLKELILQIELMPIFSFPFIVTLIEILLQTVQTYVMGMNKIASNLEAAKRELSYYLRERL
jgi:N-acetylmuramoyl-L-alanine amidase